MTERIEHVDIAKGISIVLVALFHSKITLFISDVIKPLSLFRMPLFFFLSGVFFSASAGFNRFLLKKLDALIKPYFVTLFVLFAISLFNGNEYWQWQLNGILYGNGDTISWTPLWFLTHLFVVYCFVYTLYRHTKFNSQSLAIKSILLALAVFVGTRWIDAFWYIDVSLLGKNVTLPGLPFSIDIVLISSAFFITGKILRSKVINFNPNLVLIAASVLFFVCVSVFTDAHIDFNKRVYSHPVSATLGAISGIYLILTISFLIVKTNWLKKLLIAFGKSSLFILIFHSYINSEVYQFCVSNSENRDLFFSFSVIAFLVSITIPLLFKWIASRSDVIALFYLPVQSNKLLNRIRNTYLRSK